MKQSQDWVIGRRPIEEALQAGRSCNHLLVAEGVHPGKINRITKLCSQHSVLIKKAPRSKLDQISGGSPHQGVALSVAATDYSDLWEVLEKRTKQAAPLLVILDEIEDPHNLGAIIRSADAVGADAVIIPKRRACALTQTVSKASAGAVEYVPVCRVNNLADTIRALQDKEFTIFGLAPEADTLYSEADYSGPCAIVIGSEGKGMRALTKKLCDQLLRIPSLGQVASLNASVAAGLCLFESLRSRS